MDRCEIVLYIRDPQPFLAPGTGFEKDNVSLAWGCGWAGWFIIHFVSIIIISAPLGHQALDPRSWGALPFSTRSPQQAISRAALLKSYYGGKGAELSRVWRRPVAGGCGSQRQSRDGARGVPPPSWIAGPSQRSCARPELRCGHGHFALGAGLNGQCEASALAPLWANETSPSTNEKKVRLYFITQILILGNFSWALLVTGAGMLARSELSGGILGNRGRWLAWSAYFRSNVVHLQTAVYSFCLTVFEISTWKTNGEQNSYAILSCLRWLVQTCSHSRSHPEPVIGSCSAWNGDKCGVWSETLGFGPLLGHLWNTWPWADHSTSLGLRTFLYKVRVKQDT